MPPLENLAVLQCQTQKFKNIAIALPLRNNKTVNSTIKIFKQLKKHIILPT